MTQWGLDVLFNPAKRHMDEEKRRLQSTREEIGDASGGKRIDLESGKVVIPRADAEDEDAGSSDVSTVENRAAENEPAENEPVDSAAARARARRRELRQRKA